MEHNLFKWFFLLSLWPYVSQADKISDVPLRFHAQWQVEEQKRQEIQNKYGTTRVTFTQKGQAVPRGLSAEQLKRWERLYNLCMSDGCFFCDADVGSCEIGTCGNNNDSCKPHMGPEGLPTCGQECADFAFRSTLP